MSTLKGLNIVLGSCIQPLRGCGIYVLGLLFMFDPFGIVKPKSQKF